MTPPTRLPLTILVLGGNAFAPPGAALSMAGQFAFARAALSGLKALMSTSQRLVITHGNGPQVGHMLARAEATHGSIYALPLDVCVAETQGELGYVLEQTLNNLLTEWRIHRPVATLLTQVIVDADDPAFGNPTKPIGPFLTVSRAAELRRGGCVVVEDAGRGERRVVPSPRPREIVGADVVRRLVDAGVLVICAGGGGVPVIRVHGQLHGVEAVIDKDLTSALLATELGADRLVFLTCVPCAYRDYLTPRQSPLSRLNCSDAQRLLDERHFAPGSMGPKIEAAIQFASRPGTESVICDVDGLADALSGRAGTIIRSEF